MTAAALLLVLLTPCAWAAEPAPGSAVALWTLGVAGLTKLAVPEATTLLGLPGSSGRTILALDERHGPAWAYGVGTLQRFGFDGSLEASCPVTEPGGILDPAWRPSLVALTTDGSAWPASARRSSTSARPAPCCAPSGAGRP